MYLVLLLIILLAVSGPGYGQSAAAEAGAAGLDADIASLEAEVAQLGQSVFSLEEELLHPADTRVEIFVSLPGRSALALDSLELHIDGQPVSSHLYSLRERSALQEGGVQRIYIGNLALGSHQLQASLTAQAANDRFVRHNTTFTFRKRRGETRLKLLLDAPAPAYEPVITLREWK